jgi:hypothetical protein
MCVTEPTYNSVIKHNGVMKVGQYLLMFGNSYGLIQGNGLIVVVKRAVGV